MQGTVRCHNVSSELAGNSAGIVRGTYKVVSVEFLGFNVESKQMFML
ncbi:hypothetical protein RNAN_0913 [Rheinheimera nanhaiensis E407-8]|uniref:Uncharacterized protein n=1 Tax=Rheinheimera nanhaiensis E407-8 TaxID=562729 RepID=I1DV64_9GAMM|nr:hypothetical protein RNAN_0913 [Rheinheimera nanhaiensis E407-8]